MFPLICSLSLGDFNNLELDDDDALVPPLDERLLPLPPLPLFFEGKDEMRENTEEEGGVKGGLLEELCLLSEEEKKETEGRGEGGGFKLARPIQKQFLNTSYWQLLH